MKLFTADFSLPYKKFTTNLTFSIGNDIGIREFIIIEIYKNLDTPDMQIYKEKPLTSILEKLGFNDCDILFRNTILNMLSNGLLVKSGDAAINDNTKLDKILCKSMRLNKNAITQAAVQQDQIEIIYDIVQNKVYDDYQLPEAHHFVQQSEGITLKPANTDLSKKQVPQVSIREYITECQQNESLDVLWCKPEAKILGTTIFDHGIYYQNIKNVDFEINEYMGVYIHSTKQESGSSAIKKLKNDRYTEIILDIVAEKQRQTMLGKLFNKAPLLKNTNDNFKLSDIATNLYLLENFTNTLKEQINNSIFFFLPYRFKEELNKFIIPDQGTKYAVLFDAPESTISWESNDQTKLEIISIPKGLVQTSRLLFANNKVQYGLANFMLHTNKNIEFPICYQCKKDIVNITEFINNLVTNHQDSLPRLKELAIANYKIPTTSEDQQLQRVHKDETITNHLTTQQISPDTKNNTAPISNQAIFQKVDPLINNIQNHAQKNSPSVKQVSQSNNLPPQKKQQGPHNKINSLWLNSNTKRLNVSPSSEQIELLKNYANQLFEICPVLKENNLTAVFQDLQNNRINKEALNNLYNNYKLLYNVLLKQQIKTSNIIINNFSASLIFSYLVRINNYAEKM